MFLSTYFFHVLIYVCGKGTEGGVNGSPSLVAPPPFFLSFIHLSFFIYSVYNYLQVLPVPATCIQPPPPFPAGIVSPGSDSGALQHNEGPFLNLRP